MVYLKTLGRLELLGDDHERLALRVKDLALTTYLALAPESRHNRPTLAALLWGDSAETLARHSLTQSLGRLARAGVPLGADPQGIWLTSGIPSDARTLMAEHHNLDDELSIYSGDFLSDFWLGPGGEAFNEWADQQRVLLRNQALRVLDERIAIASENGEWKRVIQLSTRAIKIDFLREAGHRQLIRALVQTGERNAALRHYESFAARLKVEVECEPDPETRALAESIRTGSNDEFFDSETPLSTPKLGTTTVPDLRPSAVKTAATTSANSSEDRNDVGSSRVDLQACKLEYSIVSPK